MKALENLKAMIPSFFSHFIDRRIQIVEIHQLVERENDFVIVTYENDNQWFLVGTIDKHEEEDLCFDDQHRNFETLEEANEEFFKLLK